MAEGSEGQEAGKVILHVLPVCNLKETLADVETEGKEEHWEAGIRISLIGVYNHIPCDCP